MTALAPEPGRVQVFQARNDGPLKRVLALPSSGPAALTRGYLGDVAVATVDPESAIAVTVQRHYASSFASPIRIAIQSGTVTALALAMDFRSDLLVVWQQNGAIYAHLLRASGRSERTQRVGPSEPDPQIQPTVSDNNHGMIAWSSTQASGTPRTTVRLALSGVNVRFEGSSTLASFADPAGLGKLAGTLALVRLAGENVVLAWTDRHGGRYRVLAAPAAFAATRPPTILTGSSEQAALAGLAPGPVNEAIALWRRLGGNSARYSEAPLWSARLNVVPHDRVAAHPAAQVTAEGSQADPGLAVNPGDDHALVAWPGRDGVRYAAASGNVTYRPHAYTGPGASRGNGHPVAAIVVGALLILIAAGFAVHFRRRRPPDPAGRIRRWPL